MKRTFSINLVAHVANFRLTSLRFTFKTIHFLSGLIPQSFCTTRKNHQPTRPFIQHQVIYFSIKLNTNKTLYPVTAADWKRDALLGSLFKM